MRTSEERVEELHRRMRLRKRDKARARYIAYGSAAGLAGLAAALFIAVKVSGMQVLFVDGSVGGASASIFAKQGALGFIVVAVLAFFLGAAVTIFCYRLHEETIDLKEETDIKR